MNIELPQIYAGSYGNVNNTVAHHCADSSSVEAFKREVLSRTQKPPLLEHTIIPLPPTSTMSKRIVRVFIADPDSNIPAEKSLLHKTEEIVTDLSDQELFYEVPIKELLEKHNAYRKTVVKKSTAPTVTESFLEPIRIRDLKMQVVVLATF